MKNLSIRKYSTCVLIAALTLMPAISLGMAQQVEQKQQNDTVSIQHAQNELQASIFNNDYKGVQAALNEGAQVNMAFKRRAQAFDKNGNKDGIYLYSNTPLIFAISHAYFPIFELLLRAGAQVNGIDSEQTSPLMVAADCKKLHYVRTLIKMGADVNAKTSCGYTALMFAAIREGRTAIIQELVNNGAELEATNNDGGWTALQCAARNNRAENAFALMLAGAKDDDQALRKAQADYRKTYVVDYTKFWHTIHQARKDMHAAAFSAPGQVMRIVADYLVGELPKASEQERKAAANSAQAGEQA